MTRRDDFLAKVRAAQPAGIARGALPYFPATFDSGRQTRFASALATMGGLCVTLASGVTPTDYIAGRFGATATIASAVDGVPGTRSLAPDTPPASLEDVDVGVVRARFGVAETGSVWFSETEYRVNALGYLVQHLVVLLDPATLVDGLQDAYRRKDFANARYAVLVTGPSATADIEGVLIRGAQGVRSLTVIWGS
ncbi:LUD domain-containing protein [Robbsia sp. Bb-Pol-6]|uniref:LUD domain-containing protein n=1 Tax=Robbsia betulipollinis TaxID=2981849 RepID=A0ABT3ZGP0_9BURK|nr:LUD domain-containing protein [Robbsia betulipollinis]MCY0385694.1 LUD domain-containing protein [Robbsia betulipollinis]